MCQVKKGDDIATFLGKCRAQFPELRGTTIDNLMYIKVSYRLAQVVISPLFTSWASARCCLPTLNRLGHITRLRSSCLYS
jgi:hypothetical protein